MSSRRNPTHRYNTLSQAATDTGFAGMRSERVHDFVWAGVRQRIDVNPTRTPYGCPLMYTLCLSKRDRRPHRTVAKPLIRLSMHILCSATPSKVCA